MPRSPSLVSLLALLAAACPGRRTPEAPGDDTGTTAPTSNEAPNLRIELDDVPGAQAAAAPGSAGDRVHAPPRLLAAWPRWLSARDPVLVLHFDRRVDPAAVLPVVRVVVEGGAPSLRLATPAERARPDVRTQLAGLDPARTVTLAFTAPLPLRAGVEVWMNDVPAPGGPRSHDRDSFSFSVHDSLRVVGIGCSSGPVCRPGAALVLRFSSHIGPSAGLRRIRVHPPLDGAVEVSGTEVYLNGATRAHQTYEVTLPADLEDMYGQTLGQPKTLRARMQGPEPSFSVTGGAASTLLAPDEPRALIARTIDVARLQVLVYAVTPADWPAHLGSMGATEDWPARAATRLGPPVLSYMVLVTGTKGQVAETTIDLGAALPRGLGHAVVDVRPVDWPDADAPRFRSWLQATRIGLDAVVDATHALVWTTDLQTGAALPGVRVELGDAVARSGADGLARLPLPTTRAAVLTATRGHDVAMLAEGGEGFVRTLPAPLLLPVVVTDRDVYQPGETVRVKGWLRRHTRGPLDELAPLSARTLTWALLDSVGGERAAGQLDLTRHDSLEFTVTLPALLNPGAARLAFSVGDERFVHPLRIAGRPQLALRVRSDAGPHIVGGHADLTASVTGGAPPFTLQWVVRQTPAHFTPPGHQDFTFARPRDANDTPPVVRDAPGEHTLRARFTALTIREPTTVIAEAAVIAEATVIDGPTILDLAPTTVTLLVHPASLYVGLRSAARFVDAGAPLVVDAVVTDLDGKRVSGRAIVVRAHTLTADGQPGRSIGACHLRSADQPVRCAVQPQGAGEHRFTATVADEQGRTQVSELALWSADEPTRRPTEPALRVIPDHDQQRAGDTARVLMLAPFAPAEGLWTLRRDGVRRSGRFTTRGASTILDIPIDAAMAPGAVLHVQLVGQQPGSSPRPAHAEGEARLTVPPAGRTLDLSFEPAPAQRLTVRVRGPDGRPVGGAEVTVFLVDDAAAARTRLTDLFADYPPELGTGTTDHRNRHDLIGTHGAPGSAYPFAPLLRSIGVLDDAVGVRLAGEHHAARVRPGAPIRLHSEHDTPIVFTSATLTDAAGRAHVTFTRPDGPTPHHALAFATAGADRFGAAQTTLGPSPIGPRMAEEDVSNARQSR